MSFRDGWRQNVAQNTKMERGRNGYTAVSECLEVTLWIQICKTIPS